MRSLSFVNIFLFVLLVYGCDNDVPPIEPPPARIKVEEAIATVHQAPSTSPCDYLLLYNNILLPLNLPDSLKENGLDVLVSFEYTGEKRTCVYEDAGQTQSMNHYVIEIKQIRRY